MEKHPAKKRLLFVQVDGRKLAHRERPRSKSLDSRIRQHVMIDIGKARRKPANASEFVTTVWSLKETSEASSSTGLGEHSESGDIRHVRGTARDPFIPKIAAQHLAPRAVMPPFIHTLSVFERDWGEDSFSAYGFTLIMVAGRDATTSDHNTLVRDPVRFSPLPEHDTAWCESTFWCPFAFKNSAFLLHYRHIFGSPHILVPLYRRSAKQLRLLALQRSLETIQCVETRLSSFDTSSATSDDVLRAVLALICYNVRFTSGFVALRGSHAANIVNQLTSLDFDQAMIHMKGILMIITARGGFSTLNANQGLKRMISWYV
jgi:hypothetical protein